MASTGPPPNYYAILEISETATTQQIRDAYKKAALKTHPDRLPADSPDRPARTRKFQLVNDAYYTLSDVSRRREYDAQRKLFGTTGSSSSSSDSGAAPGGFPPSGFEEADEEVPPPGGAGTGFGANDAYSWAWNFFANHASGNGANANAGENAGAGFDDESRRQAEDQQFGDVFEEMLREEGMAADGGDGTNRPTRAFWSMVGGMSGGALGFIVGNVPGLLAGAVAGNRLGAVRDARGKSVYAVFQELPQTDRTRLLTQLAARVFSHTVGA